MTFASGIPLLYPIGMLCAFMNYWTDKYLFIRLYKRPPLYDDGMAVRVRVLLKFAILIHCLMSFYIYSNSDIMSYKSRTYFLDLVNHKADSVIQTFFGKDISSLEKDVNTKAHSLQEYISLFESHSILQIVGLFVFLIVVLLEELFGAVTGLGRVFMYCIHNE